ncbi:sorbin and SH3 domain-containing protein 1-like isoform X2 [Tachypleus tridentatus]|uniref:sorbin and SH3 domain-containing protein 1-like isoform X2 n=1 Tax=Tachypleus tridentatus TaxID=6853 RepID=UPI003FD24FF9
MVLRLKLQVQKLDIQQTSLIREETSLWKAFQNSPNSSLVSTVCSKLPEDSKPNRESDIRNSSNLVLPLTNEYEPSSQNLVDSLHYKQREEGHPSNVVFMVEKDKLNTDSYFAMAAHDTTSNTVNIKAPSKYTFIGPLEEGIPVGLRTNVKNEHASDWYKSMFRSLHRPDEPNRDDYVTLKYKKGQISPVGGYMSEPEFNRDDGYLHHSSYASTYYQLHPDKEAKQESKCCTLPRNIYQSGACIPPLPKTSREVYKNQPRSIAEYEPGHSSLAEKEAKLNENQYLSEHTKSRLFKLRTDGYDSDSTLVRKTRGYPIESPRQQRNWCYDSKQEALTRDKVSPRTYQERSVMRRPQKPVRTTFKDDKLKKQQEEEKCRKNLEELQIRRHTDNFTPSQKSPIPLGRYDNPHESQATPLPKTLEAHNMAKVLYTFTAQTPRELSLNKGDIVYIHKEIDKNWYQGEHHGMTGIFPIKYVEVISSENALLHTHKATEGEARAKYNFHAQTSVELSLLKGDTVILTGKVDQKWYEGRIGTKKGIVPVAYLDVLHEPGETNAHSISPKSSPRLLSSLAHTPVTNGSASLHQTQNNKISHPESQSVSLTKKYDLPLLSLPSQSQTNQPPMEILHVNTFDEPIPFRGLYGYKPQHEDELEIIRGDIIYVMEKCDDGWYVGTSLRTGLFGTFPGNYVEKI